MKLCGYKEPCFKKGELWAPLDGIMCKYLIEKDRKNFCSLTNEEVKLYPDPEESTSITNK